MTPRRFASLAGALVVATIAALASYSHMRGLAVRYGQPDLIADLLPVSVDGMMVVATVALGDGRAYRWSAWCAFWCGVAASVMANVLAAQPSVIARSISAWPAVAFLLVVEVITRGTRRKNTEASQVETSSTVVTAVVPSPRKRQPARQVRRPVAESRQLLRELLADDPATPTDSLARSLGVSERRVRQLLAAGAAS